MVVVGEGELLAATLGRDWTRLVSVAPPAGGLCPTLVCTRRVLLHSPPLVVAESGPFPSSRGIPTGFPHPTTDSVDPLAHLPPTPAAQCTRTMSAPNGIELVTLPPPTLAASDSHDKLSPFADPSQALPSSANPSQLGLDSQDLDTLSSEEVGRRLNRLGTRDGEDDAQGLPPVDQGRGAWGFILASFVLEYVDRVFTAVCAVPATHPSRRDEGGRTRARGISRRWTPGSPDEFLRVTAGRSSGASATALRRYSSSSNRTTRGKRTRCRP